MPPKYKKDPYGDFDLQVIIHAGDDGAAGQATFAAASGPEGPLIDTWRKIPGLKKSTKITLTRGICSDLAFWNWILKGMSGDIQRCAGSIILRDENHNEVMRWSFARAWPTRWRGPGLTAKSNEIAIESLEIQHEGLSVPEEPPAARTESVVDAGESERPAGDAAGEAPHAPSPDQDRGRRRARR